MKVLSLASLFFALSACASSTPAATTAPDELRPEYAGQAIELSIHCAEAESPHYYEKFPGFRPGLAKLRHPAFFGCYDWHSAVHGHWAMMRVAGKFPTLPQAKEAVRILNEHLTPANIEKELAYLKANPDFEQPYGWAWFLRLSQEAAASTLPDAPKWREALRPLESFLAAASLRYINELPAPVRHGLHDNTAFALTHVFDYARVKNLPALAAAVREGGARLFAADRDCLLASEPTKGDFISPCFTEADLMRRVLSQEEFLRWFGAFLPRISPELLAPVVPADPQDYFLSHMIGLMYEKGAAMRGVAGALAEGDAHRPLLEAAAKSQASTAWELMFKSGYGGSHWIASFAIFYYDRVESEKRGANP